eukprot:g17357.t1
MARVSGDAKSSAASEYDDAAPSAATPPDPREPATATAGAHRPSASTQRVSGSATSFASAATDSQRRKRRSSLVSSGQNHLSVRLERGQTVGEEQAEDAEEGFVYHSPCGEKSQEMKLLERNSQNPSRRPSGCIVLDGGGGSFLHMKTALSGPTASVPVSTVGDKLESNEFEAKFEKFKADAERLRKKLDKLQRSEKE